ncbi:hypothetical protein WJX72_000135 [[Myrmecia] bisecta]|uniref:Uncharacterized protein n=1 Tax=[Myrmecia] bisecta TaxID=41462 RepID=A0AAW1QNJ4_9CHLO
MGSCDYYVPNRESTNKACTSNSMDWDQAKQELIELFPDEAERGRIKAKLLELPEERRLEYFEDTAAANKASLLALAGAGPDTPPRLLSRVTGIGGTVTAVLCNDIKVSALLRDKLTHKLVMTVEKFLTPFVILDAATAPTLSPQDVSEDPLPARQARKLL